jgi:DNA polymerase V
MNKKSRTIAVIDLKAFYAFVECVDRGLDAWKAPLVVADKERGKNTIVLSVTPYLKSKGIPSRLRIKELPKGIDYIYAVPRMERYIEKSSEIVSILADFVSFEDIHVYSIDEAFLDLTSYLEYYKMTPKQLVSAIINTIKEKTKLQATAGIGENFFLAKVALDIYAKKAKDGIATLTSKDIENKLWPITPLNKVWGIGIRTEAKLNALNIHTLGDLARSNVSFLKQHFGVMGEQLWNHANGIDEADMHEQYVPKETSLSIGQVLFKDYDKNNVVTIIREMVDDLANRLRKEGRETGLVSLYISYSKEEMGGFSRQMSLLNNTDDTEILFEAVMEIFNRFIKDKPIRRVGINFGKLCVPGYQQLNIFEDNKKQIERKHLQAAVDKIQLKYGKNILLRASALTEDSTAIERHNQIGGHRK